jgi:hypothetical protein
MHICLKDLFNFFFENPLSVIDLIRVLPTLKIKEKS